MSEPTKIPRSPAARRDADFIPGAYDAVRRLGDGSTGTVWEVIRRHDQARIALKIPHTALCGAGSMLASLKREVALAEYLDHPGIVKVLGLREWHQGAFVVEMELVDGITLAEHAFQSGEGFLSWAELAPLALQLAQALLHSHARGVVHRDIKPANLILTEDHHIKLTDFGCAAMADAAATLMTLPDADVSVGTLAFMSPQQLNGHAPTPADDIYAVGATLYSLLTGQPPFHSGHVVSQILSRRPRSIGRRLRELKVQNRVPSAVARLIMDCLAKKPSARPKSALALIDRLKASESPDLTRRRLLKLAPPVGLALVGGGVLFRKKASQFLVEDDFESIFDGESLSGWTGSRDIWRVENGCIIGIVKGKRTPDASSWNSQFLDWDGPLLEDFELRLDVKLTMPVDDSGNLGVRYRIEVDGSGNETSYHLEFEPSWKYNCGLRDLPARQVLARPGQIASPPTDPSQKESTIIGYLADERRLKKAFLANQWNSITIKSRGGSIFHWLNGNKIVEYREDEASTIPVAGRIGLTVFFYYGPSVHAAFRHLRIRRF